MSHSRRVSPDITRSEESYVRFAWLREHSQYLLTSSIPSLTFSIILYNSLSKEKSPFPLRLRSNRLQISKQPGRQRGRSAMSLTFGVCLTELQNNVHCWNKECLAVLSQWNKPALNKGFWIYPWRKSVLAGQEIITHQLESSTGQNFASPVISNSFKLCDRS